jgi:hypothetical protein
MLKSRKNIHDGLFWTTTKLGHFVTSKYMLILTKKHKKIHNTRLDLIFVLIFVF